MWKAYQYLAEKIILFGFASFFVLFLYENKKENTLKTNIKFLAVYNFKRFFKLIGWVFSKPNTVDIT